MGMSSVHIRASYLRRRCATRALNYQYCDDQPWFMDIWKGWVPEGIVAVDQVSHRMLKTRPTIHIAMDKKAAYIEGVMDIAELNWCSSLVGFADASRHDRRSACGWLISPSGLIFHEGCYAYRKAQPSTSE